MSRETAILLLGDQLSWSHPALQQADPETTGVILAEVRAVMGGNMARFLARHLPPG